MDEVLVEKKLAPIMNTFPDILVSTESKSAKSAKLQTINGIGKENANSFVENMDNFLQFLKDTKLEYKPSAKPPSPSPQREW